MTRGWAELYTWQLDRASRTPLTRQIYMQVRSAVLSGALHPGTRMPSSRAMASKLGVARASVVLAYEHLLAEGYVESRQGSGSWVTLPGGLVIGGSDVVVMAGPCSVETEQQILTAARGLQ